MFCEWEFPFPPHNLTIFGIGQTFQNLQVQWVGHSNCYFNLLVIFYFWHELRLIETVFCAHSTRALSLPGVASHFILIWVSEADLEGCASQGPGCGRLFMLLGWWLPLCPHPVSQQHCKALQILTLIFLSVGFIPFIGWVPLGATLPDELTESKTPPAKGPWQKTFCFWCLWRVYAN